MKNKHKPMRNLEYVAVGKKRYNYHFSFSKKDAVIRNIEIIIACIIAFMVVAGLYNVL